MRRASRLLLSCALGSGVAAAACNAILGLDPLATYSGEAGVPGAEAGDTCNHASPPPDLPSSVFSPATEFTTVIRSADLGVGDGGVRSIGFDLDHTCSCLTGVGSCVSKRALDAACIEDDVQGRDNALRIQLAVLTQSLNQDPRAIMESDVQAGLSATLIVVRGYDGTADDPSVEVYVVKSAGFTPDAGLPTFTAEDVWLVEQTEAVSTTSSRAVLRVGLRGTGYVKDGQLAARLPAATFCFGDSLGYDMTLADVVMVAKIAPAGSSFVVASGTIGGRWPVKTALSQIASFTLPNFPGHPTACSSPSLYGTLRDGLCGALDLTNHQADDGKGLACDALSAGLDFIGAPASYGGAAAGKPRTGCPDAALQVCQ